MSDHYQNYKKTHTSPVRLMYDFLPWPASKLGVCLLSSSAPSSLQQKLSIRLDEILFVCALYDTSFEIYLKIRPIDCFRAGMKVQWYSTSVTLYQPALYSTGIVLPYVLVFFRQPEQAHTSRLPGTGLHILKTSISTHKRLFVSRFQSTSAKKTHGWTRVLRLT